MDGPRSNDFEEYNEYGDQGAEDVPRPAAEAADCTESMAARRTGGRSVRVESASPATPAARSATTSTGGLMAILRGPDGVTRKYLLREAGLGPARHPLEAYYKRAARVELTGHAKEKDVSLAPRTGNLAFGVHNVTKVITRTFTLAEVKRDGLCMRLFSDNMRPTPGQLLHDSDFPEEQISISKVIVSAAEIIGFDTTFPAPLGLKMDGMVGKVYDASCPDAYAALLMRSIPAAMLDPLERPEADMTDEAFATYAPFNPKVLVGRTLAEGARKGMADMYAVDVILALYYFDLCTRDSEEGKALGRGRAQWSNVKKLKLVGSAQFVRDLGAHMCAHQAAMNMVDFNTASLSLTPLIAGGWDCAYDFVAAALNICEADYARLATLKFTLSLAIDMALLYPHIHTDIGDPREEKK
jgi:hypothetical protein